MKLCLIGSTRFMEQYHELNRQLTLAGNVVYTVATPTSMATSKSITPDQKETLDLVHLLKIQASEGVVVVTDDTGYVGESTRRELKWAAMCEVSIYGWPMEVREQDLEELNRPMWKGLL